MFNPRYRIMITKKSFPDDGFICLGSQLITIVNSIGKYMKPHVWYGADIETPGENARKYYLNDIQLKKIGDDLQLINYCNEIEQFIWREFLCVDKNFTSQNIQGIELETEDKSYRSINMQGVLIEIRTFDTSFFCIYAEDHTLISKISKIYNIEIQEIR